MALDATQDKDVNDAKQGNRPAPGIYHVLIESVEEGSSQNKGTPYYEFGLKVLTGTVPGQEGKEIPHTIYVTPKTESQLKVMAIATGILIPGAPADKGGTCEIEDLLNTVNAQLVVEVGEEKYEKDGQQKTTTRVTYSGIWPVGHKDVSHLKINQAAYDLWKNGGQPQQAAAQTAPAAGGDDPLDSI